jgi:hypothetical protein
MEIFILDSLLRPIDVVDEFISMIWTERFAERGDFELVTLSTPANRKRFVYDTMIMIPDSKRIMRVNTIEETIDIENGTTLKIKGYDLVSVLDQRLIAWKQVGGPHSGMLEAISYYHGWTPMELLYRFVWWMCVPAGGNALSPGDIIPYLQDFNTSPSLYPADTIPYPTEEIVWEQKTTSLLSAVKDLSNAYDLGFRLYKDPNAAKLYFEGYTGSDRTSAQTTLPPVIFSSDMSNLENTTEYSNNLEHFNVVVAMYEYQNPTEGENPKTLTLHERVADSQLAFSSGGFDQKTKIISVTQLPDTMVIGEVPAYLQQLAQEELTRSRPSSIFDGEIDQNADFVYERDYYLGDLVEVRGNNGGAAYMRVVEQIIKEDLNGKSSYPSLITKTSINPGTWKSWKYDVDWIDMGEGEYWNNQ